MEGPFRKVFKPKSLDNWNDVQSSGGWMHGLWWFANFARIIHSSQLIKGLKDGPRSLLWMYCAWYQTMPLHRKHVLLEDLFNSSSFGKLHVLPQQLAILQFTCFVVYLGGHAINGSKFGSGDNPTVIQNINCDGNETSLTDCSTISSTTSPCNDSTVAGLECFGKVVILCQFYNSLWWISIPGFQSISGRSEHYLF